MMMMMKIILSIDDVELKAIHTRNNDYNSKYMRVITLTSVHTTTISLLLWCGLTEVNDNIGITVRVV